MPAKRIALVAAAVAVVGIVAMKTRSRDPAAPAPAVVAAAAAGASESRPAVVLVADPREADTRCACGEIIRRVRAAKAHGVAVEELAPEDAEGTRRYGVTVVPSVVFLDTDGKVVARHEGESSEVLAAVSVRLARLEGTRR